MAIGEWNTGHLDPQSHTLPLRYQCYTGCVAMFICLVFCAIKKKIKVTTSPLYQLLLKWLTFESSVPLAGSSVVQR